MKLNLNSAKYVEATIVLNMYAFLRRILVKTVFKITNIM